MRGWQRKIILKMRYYFISILSFIILVCSCSNMKEYKYIPYDANGIMYKEKLIEAESDSVAYWQAFLWYHWDLLCASSGKISYYPYDFILADSKNKVVSIDANKVKQWKTKMFKNSFGDDTPKLDSVKSKDLQKYFNKIGEYINSDNNVVHKVHYTPNSTNKCNSYIGFSIFLHFSTLDDEPTPLRINVECKYNEYTPINIRKLIFIVNGGSFELIPQNIDVDTKIYSPRRIQEEFDEYISVKSKLLIDALLNANKATVKVVGTHTTIEQTICEDDLQSIKRTIELYKALGGLYIMKPINDKKK